MKQLEIDRPNGILELLNFESKHNNIIITSPIHSGIVIIDYDDDFIVDNHKKIQNLRKNGINFLKKSNLYKRSLVH